MRRVSVELDNNGNLFIPLKSFEDIVEISVVALYDVEVSTCKTHLIVTFWDKWNNKVELKCKPEVSNA